MSNSTNDNQNLPEVITNNQLADMSRIQSVSDQIAVIRTLLTEQMKEGEDYGKIPGVDKVCLLKPGGEKIMLLFNSYADYEEQITDLENGHREYRIKAKIISRDTGKILAVGVGSCSTMEKKYRYRNAKIATNIPVPKDYWDKSKSADQKKDILRKAYTGTAEKLGTLKLDKGWFVCELIDGENPDIADSYNVCYKIAKKRAMIDGVISTGTCSHLFTQDLDDMQPTNPEVITPKVEPVKPKLIYSYYVDELDDVDKKAIWAEAKTLCGEYKDGLLWTSVGLSNKWKSILQTSKPVASRKADVIDAEFVNPFKVEKTFADDELPENFNSK